MGNKSTPNCCCDPCKHETVECFPCCLCVCSHLCITLTTQGGETDPDCNCITKINRIPWDCGIKAWTGLIGCGIDAIFSIKRKDDGLCYFCMDSSCFGENQDQCVLLTDSISQFFEGDCYGKECDPTPNAACKDLDVTLSVTFSGGMCDPYTGATIGVKCLETIPPEANKRRCEMCNGCNCICESMCIQFVESDLLANCAATSVRTTICFDCEQDGWIISVVLSDGTPIEFLLQVKPDEFGDCVFVVSSNFNFNSDNADSELLTLNCPFDVHGNWKWIVDDVTGDFIQLLFSCNECISCDVESDVCPECCDSLDFDCVPDVVLIASFDFPETCTLGAVSIEMTRDAPPPCQKFSGFKVVNCDDPAGGPPTIGLGITVSIECDEAANACLGGQFGGNYKIKVTYAASSCVSNSGQEFLVDPELVSCDPPMFKATIPTPTNNEFPPHCCCPDNAGDTILTISL